MPTPEERIAAGQELRKRGKLSAEQDAALRELERRYGGGTTPPAMAGQRAGSNFSPQNMIDDIGAVQKMRAGQEAQFGYKPDQPWEAQSSEWRLPYFKMAEAELAKEGRSQGSFRRGMDDGSYQPQQRAPGAEAIKARAMEIAKQRNFQFLPYQRPEMTQWEAGVTGANSINPLASVAVSSADRALDGGAPGYGFGPKAARRAYENAKTEAITTHPTSYRLGQVTTLAGTQLALGAGNSPQLIVSGAQKFVSPATAARLAKQTLLNQGIKFGGRVAASGAAFTGELALYNAVAEAPNRAREAGEPMPTLGQRIDYAASELDNPWGWGTGLAAPFVGRTVRAAAAGTKNLATTGTLRQAVPQPGGSPQIVGTRADLFTPADVQRRVAMGPPLKDPINRSSKPTDLERAYDHLLKQGFDPDVAEKAVKLASYNNLSEVDEMLGELVSNPQIEQLFVALARVGGDAQKIIREAFEARNLQMPDRIRVALRDALGLSGDDMEAFGLQIAAKAKEAAAEGYSAAYGKQVSDDTWAKIYQRLLDTTDGFSPNLTNDVPDAIAAARAGAREARATANGNKAQLDAARQLDELAGALAGRAPRAPKLSTHALDFLDRGFGSRITDATPGTKRSLIGLRNAIRQSGLDADTGLNVPRTIYAQHMAAARALEFGQKAATNGTPLRDMKSQFAAAMRSADEAMEEGIGEGKSVIDQALVMGWLRGAEDLIEKSTNPSALIRQLFGSERQREKLLAMMPDLEEEVIKKSGKRIAAGDASAGDKADQTKRIKALVGSKDGKADYEFDFALGSGERAQGRVPVKSLFERQRQMLASQNRVSGNSQTANASEAIAAQGGMARLLDGIASAVMNPGQAAKNAALWAAKNTPVFKPVIFQPGVNRELGRILSTNGRERLLAVISEIRARQIATGKGPKPTGGGPVPPSGPKGGGDGFAAARAQGRVTKEERAVLFGDDPGEIRSMGFDFSRPRGLAPRQTRNDPFYDERLGPQGSQLNKAVEMRKNGYTVSEIADEMDISEKHVQQLFHLAKGRGVDIGPQARVTAAQDILFLKQKGLANSQIAQRTGAKPSVVKSVISAERKRFRDSGKEMPEWLAKEDTRGPRANGFVFGLRTDAANAAIGAGIGAIGPADSNEERVRNIALGALVGGGARRFGKAFGSEMDGATRTAGFWGGRKGGRGAPDVAPGSHADLEVVRAIRGGKGGDAIRSLPQAARTVQAAAKPKPATRLSFNPDRAITQAASRAIAKVRARMASVEDPRQYGPRMARLGQPERLDPNRPLFEQVTDQRSAAEAVAQGAPARGREYVTAERAKRIEARTERQRAGEEAARRNDVIAQKQAATRRLNDAERSLKAFYGESGTHTRFKTLKAKRAEEARLLRNVEDAKAEKARTQGLTVPARRVGDLPGENEPPVSEQYMLQELARERLGGRTVGKRQQQIERRTAEMLIDPEMSTAGAFAARAGAGGFTPPEWVARGIGYAGIAGAGGGLTLGVNALAERDKAVKRYSREYQEDRIRRSIPQDRTPPESQWGRMSREERMSFQATLNWLNSENLAGDPDGSMGPQTTAAIIEAQEILGLPVTGVPDVATRKAIAEQTEMRMMEYREKLDRRQNSLPQ